MLQVFDDNMPGPNQLSKLRQDVEVTADDLLRVPEVRPALVNLPAKVGNAWLDNLRSSCHFMLKPMELYCVTATCRCILGLITL